jgi:mono/diheme cytochrome c family protein
MTMRSRLISSLVLAAVTGAPLMAGVAAAADGSAKTALTGAAAHGRKLFLGTGCYQCHGTSGEGGGVFGPKLAPDPLPYEAVLLQLRNPRARMPVYTALVLPDADAADIYAYLQSIPKAKPAASIPLLTQSPK